MITEVIDTANAAMGSSVPARAAAHAMSGGQRQELARRALGAEQPVSALAREHQVSRKFVYQQKAKGEQALAQAFADTNEDEKVLFYLPVTRAWLQQVVLGLVLLCHSSLRGVVAFFHDLLDQSISVGTVHAIVNTAVEQARQINAAQALSAVRAGSHDELFQAAQPVLAGVDLDSMYCYLLVASEHRDGDTWGTHLLDLQAQGLNPQYIVADGGTGLRAGQAQAWPGVPCRSDVFHALREVNELVRRLDQRAYRAIGVREAREKDMQQAKRRRQGRSYSQALARARTQETDAISLAGEVATLAQWLRQDILALAGPEAATRRSLYDFVTDALAALEPQARTLIHPVRGYLVRQRDALLAFAEELDEQLQALAQRFDVSPYLLRQVLALQQLPPSHPQYGSRAATLQQQLHGRFYAIDQTLQTVRARLHRASSLVENFNSRLRNYFFLRRQIGNRYLELLRFFLNHQPFARSHHPQRRGKSPAELLTGQAHAHWLELLGFTRFQRQPLAS